jgi:hypothetical protein
MRSRMTLEHAAPNLLFSFFAVHFLPNQKRHIDYLPAAASAGQAALPVTTKPICSIMR